MANDERVKKILRCWSTVKNAYDCPCDDFKYCQGNSAHDALVLIARLEQEIKDKDAEIASLHAQLAEALAVRGW